jgi:hypothetical protein
MKIYRKIAASAAFVALAVVLGAGACEDDADRVNHNLDKEADNFQVVRRVVFYNAIKDKVILEVEGFCSVEPGDGMRMSVTCKVGNEYKRNALGTSDNVLWWYEQLENSGVSPDHYKFTVKPSAIVPDVEVR